MDAASTENLDKGLGEIVQTEVAKASSFGRTSTTEPVLHDMTSLDSGRTLRRIVGGFDGLSAELDRRARETRNMVRVLEQERPLLEAAEIEYQATCKTIAKLFPEVQDTGRVLVNMIEKTKAGDVNEALGAQFAKNLKFVDELEAATQALTENLLRLRSSWEQYARSIIRAQKMRESLPGSNSDRG